MPPAAATPVTTPEPEPTVAADVLLLLHAPLNVPSVRVDEDPKQIPEAPVIASGSGLTVTVVVAVLEQPALVTL